ncbi:ABC transporter permease [Demequina sp.]|uniref:ABC transporter permease n=1 Tax=Demequina sp. TaxID=2050685 RepID=UPI003D14A8E4
MTTETQERPLAPASGGRKIKGNPWHPTFRGVALATWIELLRRRPSKKGYVFYAIVLLGILGLGILSAVFAGPGLNSAPMELVLLLILGAGLLIGPSLSATSINGDSGEGVLAPLQMTRLSAGDLAFGKLLASWAVCFAALLTLVPFIVYAYTKSGWHLGELLTVIGVILFIVLAFTAVGLAWSSIAARAVASVSLAHLTTGFMVLGTLVLFAFTLPLVSETVTVTYRDFDYDAMTEEQQMDPNFDYSTLPCTEYTQEETVSHTEKTAWMVLINPMVVVVESSPVVNPETYEKDGRAAPGIFAQSHQLVSAARIAPDVNPVVDWCKQDDMWAQNQQEQALLPPNPWPGLATAAVLGIGAMWIVVRRLRVPYKKLRTGTRVA